MSPIPTEVEMTGAAKALASVLAEGRLPISFRYDDQPSSSLAPKWSVDTTCDGSRHTITLTDPATGLQVRIEATQFADFPAIEWVAYLRNTGAADTPIIADIQALDVVFSATQEATCTLHHARGSLCQIDDYEPLATPLELGAETRLATTSGRSSNGVLPFVNLQMGDAGVIAAVGWTGDWAATFARDGEGAICVRAGMQKTHLTLHPGEEIRTPSIALLFWEGDGTRAHNMWRRFVLAHHTPRPNGELLKAPMCAAVWGENYAANQIAKAKWWQENDIPLDVFWIDAGWHGDGTFLEGSTVFNSKWGEHVGNWWPNKGTYPDGLKPVGDVLREMNLGFVLWFEPERIYKDTYFTHTHPEWLFPQIGDNWLYNLGNPEAREALTNLISDLIAEGGVTVYRQDFNTDAAPYWEAADTPDRIGMSEIRHIEGLYRFWDDLLERHPGLVIDDCSSGGRRIDLEMISRSIPLWRSDFQCYPDFDPLSQQTQTQGLGMWVPLNCGSCDRVDTYAFRSALGPGIVICTSLYEQEPAKYFDVDWLRARMQEQARVQKYFYGDLYPLAPFSVSTEAWAALQYDRPDLGEGLVMAFRRQDCLSGTMQAALQGLEPEATYEVESLDGKATVEATGADLMAEGLKVEIDEKPGSAVFVYRKV